MNIYKISSAQYQTFLKTGKINNKTYNPEECVFLIRNSDSASSITFYGGGKASTSITLHTNRTYQFWFVSTNYRCSFPLITNLNPDDINGYAITASAWSGDTSVGTFDLVLNNTTGETFTVTLYNSTSNTESTTTSGVQGILYYREVNL